MIKPAGEQPNRRPTMKTDAIPSLGMIPCLISLKEIKKRENNKQDIGRHCFILLIYHILVYYQSCFWYLPISLFNTDKNIEFNLIYISILVIKIGIAGNAHYHQCNAQVSTVFGKRCIFKA